MSHSRPEEDEFYDKLDSPLRLLPVSTVEALSSSLSTRWHPVAEQLGYSSAEVAAFDQRDDRSPCLSMLTDWSLRSDGNTVRKLQQALKIVGRNDVAAVLDQCRRR